jgi:TetR/AcrR family transcriptional regulator, tetracycline repressor protein
LSIHLIGETVAVPEPSPDAARPARRPRGRPAVLSRESILTAAVAEIDDGGLVGCTMRAVADRLGVRAMSLYRHVGPKEAMLALVPDHLLGPTCEVVIRQVRAIDALWAVADGLRGVIDAHPRAAELLAQPVPGPSMTAAAARCVDLLVADGLPAELAYGLVRAVVAQVVGEAVTSHGPPSDVGIGLLMDGATARLAQSRRAAERPRDGSAEAPVGTSGLPS